ncbi:MAG: PfkB family carbohydrate kinase, partial [Burkholderiaceae bacterium]
RALSALRTRLLPLVTVLTPNIPEAELLLGHEIKNGSDAEAALGELLQLGAPAVLLKGGHLAGRKLIDRLDDGGQMHEFVHERLKVEGHGTGCTLASAIACKLALGAGLADACADAGEYVNGALRHAFRPGTGAVSVLDHLWRLRSGG